MRLVRSSMPGVSEQEQIIQLLCERAVLTRMVCQELIDADPADRRPHVALFILLSWIKENRAELSPWEARADEGLDHVAAPGDFGDILAEIKAGAEVCSAVFMLLTSDSSLQAVGDKAVIKTRLAHYWDHYPHPARVAR